MATRGRRGCRSLDKLDLLLKAGRGGIEGPEANSSFKEMARHCGDREKVAYVDFMVWQYAPAAQICGFHLSDAEYAVADICVAFWAPIRACPSNAFGR